MAEDEPEENYLLTYDGLDDPTPEAIDEARTAFPAHLLEEIMPGVMAVTAPASDIHIAGAALKRWRLAPRRLLASAPPHTARVKTRRP